MKDPTEALWKLMNIIERSTKKDVKVGWELREGTKVFGPDTKAKCPNCNSWIPTNRIWLVDENDNILKGCWHKDGSRVEKIIHPHVPYSGQICLGDAGGISNALFAGVASGRHYHSTERWFSQLGHDCVNAVKADCIGCETEYYESELCEGNGCDPCINKRILKFCDNCGRCSLPDDLIEGICSDCENEIYRCRHCGRNQVGEEGDICDRCVCRYDDCGEEVEEDSRYCSGHQFECQCEHGCGCETRLDEADICDWCRDNCGEEEEEEIHTCSCSCVCSNQVEEEGQKCGSCTDLDTIPIPWPVGTTYPPNL